MRERLIAAMTTPESHRREGRWRVALSGLTPQVLAIVAVLLFVRTISATNGDIFAAASTRPLEALFRGSLRPFAALLVMAVPILLAIVATANLGPRRGARRIAAMTAAVIASSGVGALLRVGMGWALGLGSGPHYVRGMLLYVWPRYALLGGMFAVAYEFYRREGASVRGMQQAEIERVAFEREMAEARLQVLQAQIEPHFLFNTLANVRRLYDVDRARGRTMLENLMRYFEVALPRMRERESSLGRECELVEAFLRIQQIRMGQRLAFTIDVPTPLLADPLPPMILLTLVENAIKHGVNPSPQGGLVRVSARREGEQLILSVADTGVGFEAGSGGGTGLANVRARLAAQFGDGAGLALQNNELGGVTATIVLPSAEEAIVA